VARYTDTVSCMTIWWSWVRPVARLARLAGIRAEIGYKRKPGKYGGRPSVVVDNTLDRQFDVTAPVMHTASKFKQMLSVAKGSIVIVSSVSGLQANIGNPAYAASKAAAISLTKTLGQSWARDGIRVNGLVPTKLTAVTIQNKERAEASLRAIPVRRMGTPEEMAGAAMFLASPLASYVQGHTLIADGGLTL
jgi:NAD(P)-dependent dehydrogenase (short-subunit alcohol dehydrogenase family)